MIIRMISMTRLDQKSVTIRMDEWELAERAAEKKGKAPTRWIREVIQKAAWRELESVGVPQA